MRKKLRMNKELLLSPGQMDFVNSEQQQTLFCGGLGSGKTFGGAVWAVKMIMEYPDTAGLITANSYSQLRKATLVAFFQMLDMLGIKYKYNRNENTVHVGNTVIYCISMEKYDLLRGIEIGWAWSDECAFYRKEAFDVLCGRIRHKRGPCQWKGTTTPNGFNWLYDHFVSNGSKDKEVVYSRTMDNLANLPESYIKQLQEQYDSRLAQQELEGQFVNLNSGSVYHAFDRRLHVKHIDANDNDLWFMGMDFNVHPLCGVFLVQRGKMLYIVDELYLENSNTFAAAKDIIKRYPTKGIQVYADETGNRRKSSSSTTDHEILRRANLHVKPFKNPPVKDRINNLNRLFERNYIKINPRCVKLIEDLERLTHENDNPLLSHISDALGYAAWGLDPMHRPKRSANIRY